MHSKKTGGLIKTCLERGGLISNLPKEETDLLSSFGEKIGLAFQVVDDVLDITGTEQEIGKPVGSDLMNGIITLPTIYAIEDVNCRQKVEMFLNNPSNTDLHSEILEMVKASNVKDRSYKYADKLIEEAKGSLSNLEDNDHKRSLMALADFIISRNK